MLKSMNIKQILSLYEMEPDDMVEELPHARDIRIENSLIRDWVSLRSAYGSACKYAKSEQLICSAL